MTGRGASSDDAELAEVVRLELLLHDPSVRSSRARVASLLHPDFAEVGASGRSWDATGIVDAIADDGIADEADEEAGDKIGGGGAVDVTKLSASRLAVDVVLVTYESHRSDRVTMRSSVWVRVGSQWTIRYHQGTPVVT